MALALAIQPHWLVHGAAAGAARPRRCGGPRLVASRWPPIHRTINPADDIMLPLAADVSFDDVLADLADSSATDAAVHLARVAEELIDCLDFDQVLAAVEEAESRGGDPAYTRLTGPSPLPACLGSAKDGGLPPLPSDGLPHWVRAQLAEAHRLLSFHYQAEYATQPAPPIPAAAGSMRSGPACPEHSAMCLWAD